MKLKWKLLPVVAVVVLIVAALGLRLWFNSPGVRVLGKELHVDLSQKCFLFDKETGDLLDETVVTVKGVTSRTDRQLFDGELKILGYQNSASGTVTALKAIEVTDSGCWTITHLENCTHEETDDNGITKPVEHFCDYNYTYYLYPGSPEKTVVLIETFYKYQPVYAVCAESEEEALERYEEFMKNKP